MSVEKIDELTPIVNGLADNKASVFAYTEQAYQDNDVTGVSQYDFSKEQNIPDKNSTDTNPQVLTKGFRSQGSSIPRNFINHFIGRCSYNLNKIIDVFQSFITSYKSDYQKNGFMYNATLPYQVGDVCMDVWSDNTFAFFVRTGNGGSTGVRPMVASDTGWTVNEHWSCLGTPQNTSQSFILRDSDGRAQVATPSAATDIANKQYVDSTSSSEAAVVQTNLTSHINNQDEGVHGSTSAATAGKLMIRDSAGRAQVANPSAANDIANKQYVDGKTWDASDITTGVFPIERGGTGSANIAQARQNLAFTFLLDNAGDMTSKELLIKIGEKYTIYNPLFLIVGSLFGDSVDSDITFPSPIGVVSTKSCMIILQLQDGKFTSTTNNWCTVSGIIIKGGGKAYRYTATQNGTATITESCALLTETLSDLGISASATELNYCDGLTGNIQQQINAISAGTIPYKEVGTLKANVEFNNSFTVSEDGWYLLCFINKNTSNNFSVGSPMYLPASSTFSFDGYLNLNGSGIICIAYATIPGSTNTLCFNAAVSDVYVIGSITMALYEMVT